LSCYSYLHFDVHTSDPVTCICHSSCFAKFQIAMLLVLLLVILVIPDIPHNVTCNPTPDVAQVSRRPSTVDGSVSLDLAMAGTATDSLWDDMGSLTGLKGPEYEFTPDQEAIILELEAAMTKAATAGLWLALSEVQLSKMCLGLVPVVVSQSGTCCAAH
jgi:hypothetical protein